MRFVFDVDGTLTPSRQRIDDEFGSWFLNWCQTHKVYLVTGSDYEKTIEQLGADICYAVNGIFNCAGNAHYIRGELQYENEFKLTTKQKTFLVGLLDYSKCPIKTGRHIEERNGMVNFSTVGRNARLEQREQYVKYDTETGERRKLAKLIMEQFSDLEACIGGETGIDIYHRGRDKSQVVKHIGSFTFFGDATYPGGNDYTIAKLAATYYQVTRWNTTYKILRDKYDH